MKTIDIHARYGYVHKLEHVGGDLWVFKSDKKCSGMYRIIGNLGDIKGFDPEGGPFLSVGDKVGDYTIKSITSGGIFELI